MQHVACSPLAIACCTHNNSGQVHVHQRRRRRRHHYMTQQFNLVQPLGRCATEQLSRGQRVTDEFVNSLS